MDKSLIIYLASIGAGGAFLIWWIRRHIATAEEDRKTRVEELKRFDPIKTRTPFDMPLRLARKTALEGLETRFSIIRKIIVLSMTGLWIFALTFPFIHNVPATLISLLIATAGVVVGIASRPFVENLVCGIVITFGHTLRVGHTVVIDGNYGTVEDISITHTTIKIWNWRRYVIPNSRMLQKEFVNLTISDSYQWAHVEFFVAYGTDLQVVRAAAIQAASESSYFSDRETPRFWVMDMEKAAIKCWVAAWASSPTNAWLLRHEIRTNLVLSLAEADIKTHLHEIIDRSGSPVGEQCGGATPTAGEQALG